MKRENRREIPEIEGEAAEDPKILRRRQLDRILSHAGQIEMDVDGETLVRLRAMECQPLDE